MNNKLNISSSDFWNNCYETSDIGWDLGKATPIFVDWCKKLENDCQSICVPGSGNGYDPLYFASKGHRVTAIDFAEQPIKQLKKEAKDNNLNLNASYNKNKHVPFGEFLPMEKYFKKLGLKKITYGYKSFSKGEQRNVINIKNKYYDFKLLPLICYEIIYSGKINIKKQNVDLIVNISEDGWFGNSIGPYQHFNKAIYRAIEEGNYIARSANNGISAFIGPNGRTLNKTEFNKASTSVSSLPMYKSKTIFSKYGNKVFVIIIFLYILLIFYFKKVEKNEEKKLSFYK